MIGTTAALLGAAALGAGGSIAGGMLSNRGKKLTPAEQQAQSQQLANMRQGAGYANQLFPMGTDYLQRGTNTLSPVLQYYASLLGGNRNALLQQLSPEVEQINQGYDSAFQSSRNLAPRGGGSSALYSELPFRKSADISSLFMNARPAAAAGLGEIGTNFMNTGLNTLSNVSPLLAGSSGTGSNMMYLGQRERDAQFDRTAATTRGIFDVIRSVPWGNIFNSGSSGLSSLSSRSIQDLPGWGSHLLR